MKKNWKIFLANATSAPVTELFGPGFEITTVMKEADILLLRSAWINGGVDRFRHNGLTLEQFPHCRYIGRLGAETNNIPISLATEKGILVFHSPAANAESVAQQVILTAGAALRNYFPARSFAQNAPVKKDTLEWMETQKSRFLGRMLDSSVTIGVIGANGNIGKRVTEHALHFGMQVVVNEKPEILDMMPASGNITKAYQLEDLVPVCDIITCHTPGNKEIVSYDLVRQVRQGAVLVDFARGGSFNPDAVAEQIAEKKIIFLTDFATERALHMQQDFPDHVFVFPHMGGLTTRAEHDCAAMAIAAIKKNIETGEIMYCKNPDAALRVA